MHRALRRSIRSVVLMGAVGFASMAVAQQASEPAKGQGADRQGKAAVAKRKDAPKKDGSAPPKLDAAGAQSEVEAGVNALAQGRHDNAVTSLSAALSAGSLPQSQTARALYYRGVAHRRQGKPAQAISDLTSSLWIKNGLSEEQRADALQQRSGAYREAGLPDQAEPPGARPAPKTTAGSAKSGSTAMFTAVAPAAPSSGLSSAGSFFSSLFGGGSSANTSTAPATSPTVAAAAAPTPPTPAPSRSAPPTPSRPAAVAAAPPAPAAERPQTRTVPLIGNARSMPTGFPDMPEPTRHVEASTRSPARVASAAASPGSEVVARSWTESTKVKTATPPSQPRVAGATPVEPPAATQPPAQPAGRGRAAAVQPVTGNVRVVVAAVRSAEEAQGVASRLQTRFGRELAGRAPVVDQTTVGGLGTLYRVQVGPFASASDTETLCTRLKTEGLDCRVVVQ